MLRLEERTVRVAISESCNLHCVYCDGPNERSKDKPGAMEDFRRRPLTHPRLDAAMVLEIIGALRNAGFGGVTLTGGEPLLSREWGAIVDGAKAVGMRRVGVTTNGILLSSYLRKTGALPSGLTLLTISLDTVVPERYRALTGGGDLAEVMRGLSAARRIRPDLAIRANKILMRSDMSGLVYYVRTCETTGLVDEINLLNLILKGPMDAAFFEREFVFAREATEALSCLGGTPWRVDSKDEFESTLPSGLRIIVKDTDATFRTSQCIGCPIFCQEGLFTARVATDGAITACPDYNAALAYIDGVDEYRKGTLSARLAELAKTLSKASATSSLDDFFRLKGIRLSTKRAGPKADVGQSEPA